MNFYLFFFFKYYTKLSLKLLGAIKNGSFTAFNSSEFMLYLNELHSKDLIPQWVL